MTLLSKSGDLAWCGLVALAPAKQGGLIQSVSQENLFITRWFAPTKKQRRFPREVAPDFDWILHQGRAPGVRARLRDKLNYMWQSSQGQLLQNDLFRLRQLHMPA